MKSATNRYMLSIVIFLCTSCGIVHSYELNVIPSWGDSVFVHGPGTDAAMDSPETMENMIKHFRDRGYTGLYLRTDLAQVSPFIYYHNLGKLTPAGALYRKNLDDLMSNFDVHVTAQKLCDKYGLKYWAFHPHLYSDGAPREAGSPGPGRIWPWSYCAKYTFDHSEVITIDRKGNMYWMVREYAYPGARSSKVDEFVYMAKHFGLRRFIPCMRSEASQIQPPADKADRFGFNAPVVHDMKALFGVDIMTDPRFDVDSPTFDPCDPMVQNWHNLRGTYITQFYRELRERLNEVDPNIQIAASLSGDYVGPIIGNIRLDWRTWVDEGLVDEIITPVTFEATLDLNSTSKGYLTDVRADKGVVSFLTLKNYIKNSKHPGIKIIATNSLPPYLSPYDYSSPPEGADGWRIDYWYDSYTLAWFQRWQQWKKDIKDFGYIKFFEQNFDGFPINNSGYSGGWGDERYHPELRACPGAWSTLGDGNDAKPTAQNVIKHGLSGNAFKLTRGDTDTSLIGWHLSWSNRGEYTSCVDNSITNGTCEFEFWLYRPDENSSVSVYLKSGAALFQKASIELDVGLHIESLTGKLAYSDHGKWVSCDYAMPVGQWQKFTIKVNLDKQHYAAYAGTDQNIELCDKIGYSIPKVSYVELPTVHVPIAVTPYRMFNQVCFSPDGQAGNVLYLDDVSVKWIPTMYYTEPGKNTYFSDDFESHIVDAGINGNNAPHDGKWVVSSEKPDSCFVSNDTSFGEGVKCLHVKGGADLIAGRDKKLRLGSDNIVTLDFDIFIRSDKDYPYIMPNPATTSNHRSTISLEKDSKKPIISVYAGEGTWQVWDGTKYVDSTIKIDYSVWNHVQLALDSSSGSYNIVIQPLGEMPVFAAKAKWAKGTKPGDEVYLRISQPSSTLYSLYDNVAIACTQKKTE